ncbi:hypothetical protein DL764_004819 [Monosporascus ibericus]|uniref:Uncharacterized protein n=1 Tax=Monosporascus ibericus TaxID=155417 RepID=A0A4Q4TF67_9PEZI|nr:hypothetical protein DL764_004819 [Monosporascus ibericus]
MGQDLPYGMPAKVSVPGTSGLAGRAERPYSYPPVYTSRLSPESYGNLGIVPKPSYTTMSSQNWDTQGRYSPPDPVDDILASPSASDYSLENGAGTGASKSKGSTRGRPQRRPSNRDEFDGPHQFLARPPPDYVAMQERELPHLPTNLLVQEQDSVLTRVNDRLSQCAFDFVAKYQFPIPLTQDMRPVSHYLSRQLVLEPCLKAYKPEPSSADMLCSALFLKPQADSTPKVERPQDREWTEWVYLLKRLATKRRIPARVLYNGQIKQFVTILENSLEMRHAAKHQSRPLKDDRNILQLISAGIQVAKILKDAPAMQYLDNLYVSTEQQIQERSAAASVRFR